MRLILKNYGIHKLKEFNLPDSGFVLFCGVNGTGKSTVIRAIQFALYGNQQRVCSRYEKTCSVTLEFEGMKIERFIPARLNVQYEGVTVTSDAAQHTINKVMGMNCDVFNVSSCIQQRSIKNSVISMTPAEQLIFVENIAAVGCDHEKNRKMIHALVISTEKELLVSKKEAEKSKCKYEVTKESMPTKVKQPSMENGPKTKKEAIESLDVANKKINSINMLITKLSEKHKEELASQNITRDIEQKIKHLQSELDHISSMITFVSDEEISNLENDLSITKTLLLSTIAHNTHTTDYVKARDMKNKFLATLKADLTALKKLIPTVEDIAQLESDIKTLNDVNATYEVYTKHRVVYEYSERMANSLYNDICKTFNILMPTENIHNILKMILEKSSQKHVVCPCCTAPLIITRSLNLESTMGAVVISSKKKGGRPLKNKGCLAPILIPTVELVSDELSNLNMNLVPPNVLNPTYDQALVTNYLNKLEGISVIIKPEVVVYDSEFHQSLKERLLEIRTAESKLLSLSNKNKIVYPPHVVAAYKELKRLESMFPEGFVPETTVEILTNKINALQVELGMLRKTQITTDAQKKECAKKEKLLQDLSSKLKPRFLGKNSDKTLSPQEEISSKQNEVSILMGHVEKLKDLIRSFADYEVYKVCVDRLSVAKEQMHSDTTKLVQLENEYKGILMLETLYKEKEYSILEKIINVVNGYARPHIDSFFSDPIVVKLSNKRLNGSGDVKMQMNTIVDYRCDDKRDLSGGEVQKCELSYMIGVNEMFDGRLLFLDECANSVDKAANMTLLTYIREWCSGMNENGVKKLVFSVGHEAVTGVFDEIVYF